MEDEQDIHIRVRDLVKRFGQNEVLRGISLDIPRKETVVIIGGSGAGKTTLLRILIGLEKPTSGQVLIDGEDIAPMTQRQLNRVRKKFGMVFQYSALLDSLTVLENVEFPLREHTKMKPKQMREKVVDALVGLGLQAEDADKFPSQLSGGMKKRVGLARALMLEPKILIYDEPTSGLDPLSSRMVDDLITETRERYGITSVVISHDMTSTFKIAHKAFLLVRGKVVAAGAPADLADPRKSRVAHEFIAASGVDYERLGKAER